MTHNAASSNLQSSGHFDELFLRYLLAYAPQLGIRGMGGEYEDEIEAYYRSTLRPSSADPDRLVCADNIALGGRLEEGAVFWSSVACNYIQGDIGGPPVFTFEIFDYVRWLLSSACSWMPEKHSCRPSSRYCRVERLAVAHTPDASNGS